MRLERNARNKERRDQKIKGLDNLPNKGGRVDAFKGLCNELDVIGTVSYRN